MTQLKRKPAPGGAKAGGAFSAPQGWKGSKLFIPPVVRIRPHSAPSSPVLGMTLGKVTSMEHLTWELTILLVAGGRVPQFPLAIAPFVYLLLRGSGIATSVSAFDISSWMPCWLFLLLRCVSIKSSCGEEK